MEMLNTSFSQVTTESYCSLDFSLYLERLPYSIIHLQQQSTPLHQV